MEPRTTGHGAIGRDPDRSLDTFRRGSVTALGYCLVLEGKGRVDGMTLGRWSSNKRARERPWPGATARELAGGFGACDSG
jgi:hypothetical protein